MEQQFTVSLISSHILCHSFTPLCLSATDYLFIWSDSLKVGILNFDGGSHGSWGLVLWSQQSFPQLHMRNPCCIFHLDRYPLHFFHQFAKLLHPGFRGYFIHCVYWTHEPMNPVQPEVQSHSQEVKFNWLLQWYPWPRGFHMLRRWWVWMWWTGGKGMKMRGRCGVWWYASS